jgi:hypothetical protein
MVIKNLGQRYPELGRIRLGERVKATGKDGKEVERPKKGDTLIFTSNDEVTLKALASQHGGEVEAWEGGQEAWRLVSGTAMVPAFLPPDPIDTAYERWGSGGIAKRCDGERCLVPVTDGQGGYMEERDCACLAEGVTPGDRQDIAKRGACTVTVRVRLVLPDVPGLGIWICTSHSVYAALELPAQVGLLQQAMAAGSGLIPVDFGIEKRVEKKPWEKYERDYIVPVLRVRASLAQIASGANGLASLGGPQPPLAAPAAPAAIGPVAAMPAAGAAGDAFPEWTHEDLRARFEALDAEHRALALAAFDAEGLPQSRSPGFTAEHAFRAQLVMGRLADQQRDAHLKRQRHANAAMAKAGVKADDERHALISEATGGEAESSAHLSAAQLAAVVDACDGLVAGPASARAAADAVGEG